MAPFAVGMVLLSVHIWRLLLRGSHGATWCSRGRRRSWVVQRGARNLRIGL